MTWLLIAAVTIPAAVIAWAAEVVAREEAAWIDAEWPVVSREWSS